LTIVSLVIASDRRGVIGRDGRLPWHLPADLRHFRMLTMGKPVVMGRRTWDSIGRPLPGRHNIVVTRQRGLALEGATVVHSIDEALHAAGNVPEVCVIGGAEICAQALPRADVVHLTLVEAEVEGDTRLPPIDAVQWRETARESHAADERNALPYSFVTLERRS
jgi:dihydrofolate reductase